MKKPLKTILIDIFDNLLYGLLLGAVICGFWFVAVFITYLSGNIPLVMDRWFMIAAFLVAVLVTFGILRYLGRGARK